jgi:hypothetical protein
MISMIAFMLTGPIGNPSLGIILPAVIFILSFVTTWMLFRHFSKK